MLKKTFAVSLLLLSNSALADYPPSNCVVGDPGPGGPYYKLSLKSPEYAIVNTPTTIKISGPELAGNTEGRTVDFQTQYEGIQTPFKLDYWDGEDYKTHIFYNIGENWAWAWKEITCSKDLIFVHERPTVNVDSQITSDNYTSDATFNLDSRFFIFSKAEREGLNMKYEIQRKVISKISSNRRYCDVVEESTNWEIAQFNSNQTFQASESCEVLYKIRSFDGAHYSFSKSVRLAAFPTSGGGGGNGGGNGGGTCSGPICSEEP